MDGIQAKMVHDPLMYTGLSGSTTLGQRIATAPSDGDLSGILDRVREITARVLDIRHRLDEKGDAVFGAVPTACANGKAENSAPLGGVSYIYDGLDGLSSEVESLRYAAQRFERL